MKGALVKILVLFYVIGCAIATPGKSRRNRARQSREVTIFDFTRANDVSKWEERSDSLDGGNSKGTFVLHETETFKRGIFFSVLNLINGSGFTGERFVQHWDLSSKKNILIRCRGQGEHNSYKIVLRHKGEIERTQNVYEVIFEAPRVDFATVTVSLSDFKAYYQGLEVPDAEPLDLATISAVGLQFYGGKFRAIQQEGVASLEIDWIKAV